MKSTSTQKNPCKLCAFKFCLALSDWKKSNCFCFTSLKVFPKIMFPTIILFWSCRMKKVSYSFLNNFPFTEGKLEDVIVSAGLQKLFKGRNYSKKETIWGNSFSELCFYHSSLCPLFQVRLWRNLWSYTGLSQSCPYSHWSGRKKRYQSDPISSLWVERSFQAQQFIQGSIHLQRIYIFTFTGKYGHLQHSIYTAFGVGRVGAS